MKFRIRKPGRRTVVGVTTLGVVAAGLTVAASKGRLGSTEDNVQLGDRTEAVPSGKPTSGGVTGA